MPEYSKAWENRMRRRIRAQGAFLSKSAARIEVATDSGHYDVSRDGVSLSHGYTLAPEDVEKWATEGIPT